jgi:CRP/FNR family transcriptional regulator, cyclic AMP receptor protein
MVLDAQSFPAILKVNPFFSGLGEEAITAVAALCTTQRLGPAETLFQKGDPGSALYAVRRGQVRISTGTGSGKRLTLNILGSGDVFGEIALLDGRPRTADATALESTELFVLQRRDFLIFLEQNSTVAIRLIELLCERVRWMSDRVEETALLTIEVRLARRLLMLARDYGSEIQISQDELAQFVGTSRESVNRQLQDWRRAGLLTLGRSRITLLDLSGLSARSEASQDD